MLLPLGEMRESVVLMTPVVSIDESGGEKTTYSNSDPLFVSIRALSAKEAQQFGQINSEISHVCFGHWHDLNSIRSDTRLMVLETLQEFDIVGPPINSPERDWSKLTLVWRENG